MSVALVSGKWYQFTNRDNTCFLKRAQFRGYTTNQDFPFWFTLETGFHVNFREAPEVLPCGEPGPQKVPPAQSNGSTAPDILDKASGHMKDRAATYDKPDGERSMAATVRAFEAISGVTLTEEQGWLFMATLKAVRSQQGKLRMDSYEDGAAYFALAGEIAAKTREE